MKYLLIVSIIYSLSFSMNIKDLHTLCSTNQNKAQLMCKYYIYGLIDGILEENSNTRDLIPTGTTKEELYKKAKKEILASPNKTTRAAQTIKHTIIKSYIK